MRFTLYGRGWCHLCDEMRDALAPVAAECSASVDYVDIDADPALVARYDEDVPVLLLDGVEVCRHRFDEARVRARSRGAARDAPLSGVGGRAGWYTTAYVRRFAPPVEPINDRATGNWPAHARTSKMPPLTGLFG